MDIKAVFITVQHTGTHAALEYLGTDINQVIQIDQVKVVGPYPDLAFGHVQGPIGEGFRLLSGNTKQLTQYLANATMLFTLRDPLASMISVIVNESASPEQHVSDWLALVQLIARHGGRRISSPATVSESDDSDLRTAYRARDLAYIEATMPKELQLLKDVEPSLRPVLERHGFADLMWWSL